MKYDIIVIGGGLGGLTAGAKLAKGGKKVLLVEQHDRPGGCATTFKRKDFIMEVGLHEMDGLHQGDLKAKIFRDLGLFEKVEFLPLPEFYRFINGRYSIVVPHDAAEASAILTENFPGEENGIKEYFNTLLNARKIVSGSASIPDRSVGEWLDEIISNEDLKLVLLGNLGYFHDDPYTLSFYYYITAQGSYYNGRANYIKGGSQELSNALVDIITENGGTVKLNTLATSVYYQENIPAGVVCRGTRSGAEKEQTYLADIIVAGSSLHRLADGLLSDRDGRALLNEIGKINNGASLLTVYYGFRKPLKEVGNKNYSLFIYDDSVKCQADILGNNHALFENRSFTFVDYSQVDSGLTGEGKSVGAVCCVDYVSDWNNMTAEDYRQKKREVAGIFTERLEKVIPGFADAVEYVEVATSKTVERYTLNKDGAVYGFAQNPGKQNSYLELLPDNIYIASAWGKFGGGFSGAIYSGYMTAMEILRKR